MERYTKSQQMQLDQLIEELTKDRPNLHFVKQHMQLLGLPYSDDPIERLNTVLMSLHPQVQEGRVKEIEP